MSKRLLFNLIQWTWGIPQNLAGLAIYLAQRKEDRGIRYQDTRVARWDRETSLSMGMFIFLGRDAGERLLRHEYGHSRQSLLLGPAYLIAVGVPSIVWCCFGPVAAKWQSGERSYYSVYPENWADRLGHAVSAPAVCSAGPEHDPEEISGHVQG